jgi:hypothetical protein
MLMLLCITRIAAMRFFGLHIKRGPAYLHIIKSDKALKSSRSSRKCEDEGRRSWP